MNSNYVVPLSSITSKNRSEVGLPALELAELMTANVPIAPGFVITQSALELFAHNAQLDAKARQLQQMGTYNESTLTKLIFESAIPEEIYNSISKEYSYLSGISGIWVRLRAGLYDADGNPLTFIDEEEVNEVKGFEALELEIKKIWSKLLVIDQKYDSLGSFIIVQKLIPAETSGYIYTQDKLGNNLDQILIKAVYGEYKKDISSFCDSYVFSKSQEKIIDRQIAPQTKMYIKSTKSEMGYDTIEISDKYRYKQKLSDKYIEDLSYLGDYLENVFSKPQTVSWSFQGGKPWINYVKPISEENPMMETEEEKEIEQSYNVINPIIEKEERNYEKDIIDIQVPTKLDSINVDEIEITQDKIITATIPQTEQEKITENIENKFDIEQKQEVSEFDLNLRREVISEDVLLAGIGNNKGIVSGHIVFDKNIIKPNDILAVTTLSKIDFDINSLKGIIVEDILNNIETDIPLIYGAQMATKILRSDEIIKLDSDTGFIFEDRSPVKEEIENKSVISSMQPSQIEQISSFQIENDEIQVETSIEQTKPEKKEKKTEIIQEKLQEKQIIEIKKEKIKTAIKVFARIKTMVRNEISNADGFIIDLPHAGDYISSTKNKIEYSNISNLIYNFVLPILKDTKDNVIYSIYDANPSIYIKNYELLNVQCEAVHKLRNKENLRNLHIALPKFKTIKQLREFRKSLSAVGLRRSTTFKVYIKVAYSSNIFELSQYLEDRFDGVIIDIHSLYNSLYSSDKRIIKITDTLLKAITQMQKECKSAKIPLILDLGGIKVTKNTLEKLAPSIIYGLAVGPKYTDYTKKYISDIEKKRIFK